MTSKALKRDRLTDWLAAIAASERRLVAPTQSGDQILFKEVDEVNRVLTDYGNTHFSLKEFVFPRTEPILHYRFVGSEVVLEDPQLDQQETVAFGARPCDAAGLVVLDRVFSADYPDDFYLLRRERLTVIGLACSEPGPQCFCTAVGLSPTAGQGSDILLTQIGDEYLVEVNSEKGERLLAESGYLFEPDATAVQRLAQQKATVANAVAQKVQRQVALHGVGATLQAEFDSPDWVMATMKCLGCGVCAYVCPTCHCFDIVDESDSWGGRRCKNWDSCAFALFTLHTSGHNPRPTQDTRYRQRVMHKFCYYPDRFEQTMCVGCGRCVVQCPVNLDIYQITHLMGRVAVSAGTVGACS